MPSSPPGFLAEAPATGVQIHAFPSPTTRIRSFSGTRLGLEPGATHYGFVAAGPAWLEASTLRFPLASGMYFCLPGAGRVEGSLGLVVSEHGYHGLFALGGPIERSGRLRYIDGCTDTLLLAPARRGDPCLNLLHFPARIAQTRHAHPSLRAGIVARGAGECVLERGRVSLSEGTVFAIGAGVEHAFRTADGPMTVIAYHPDSDHGPSDDDHPMINRTLVDGVSAARIGAIRTE